MALLLSTCHTRTSADFQRVGERLRYFEFAAPEFGADDQEASVWGPAFVIKWPRFFKPYVVATLTEST